MHTSVRNVSLFLRRLINSIRPEWCRYAQGLKKVLYLFLVYTDTDFLVGRRDQPPFVLAEGRGTSSPWGSAPSTATYVVVQCFLHILWGTTPPWPPSGGTLCRRHASTAPTWTAASDTGDGTPTPPSHQRRHGLPAVMRHVPAPLPACGRPCAAPAACRAWLPGGGVPGSCGARNTCLAPGVAPDRDATPRPCPHLVVPYHVLVWRRAAVLVYVARAPGTGWATGMGGPFTVCASTRPKRPGCTAVPLPPPRGRQA